MKTCLGHDEPHSVGDLHFQAIVGTDFSTYPGFLQRSHVQIPAMCKSGAEITSFGQEQNKRIECIRYLFIDIRNIPMDEIRSRKGAQ